MKAWPWIALVVTFGWRPALAKTGASARETDPIAVAQGKKLCMDLAPILDQVKATRDDRHATPLYKRYEALRSSLDQPEKAPTDTLVKAAAIRDEWVTECMKRPDWTAESCRQGDVALPLAEAMVKVAIAQKNVALAYAENEIIKGVEDLSTVESEFLGELHRHPLKRRLDSTCVATNVWRLPGAAKQPPRFDMTSDILTTAGLDASTGAGKVYVKGLVKTVGTGATVTIAFDEIQRVGTYTDPCRWVTPSGGRTPEKVCDQHTSVGTEAIPPPIKLSSSEVTGIKPGQILYAAVHPTTRVGYVIRLYERADLLDDHGTKLLKVRGMTL
ncbi:MAG: hypothetical protein ACHREM_09190 [Polyangiales bacterium]